MHKKTKSDILKENSSFNLLKIVLCVKARSHTAICKDWDTSEMQIMPTCSIAPFLGSCPEAWPSDEFVIKKCVTYVQFISEVSFTWIKSNVNNTWLRQNFKCGSFRSLSLDRKFFFEIGNTTVLAAKSPTTEITEVCVLWLSLIWLL